MNSWEENRRQCTSDNGNHPAYRWFTFRVKYRTLEQAMEVDRKGKKHRAQGSWLMGCSAVLAWARSVTVT
jgi:uncharacterized protein